MKRRSTLTKALAFMLAAAFALVALGMISCAPATSGTSNSQDSTMSVSDVPMSASSASSSSSSSASSSSASSSSSEPSSTLVSVPNVVSLSSDDAKKTISETGLKVGDVQTKHSNDVSVGHVISQNPTSGTMVEKGTSIKLVVSLGKESARNVVVPDLRGMTRKEAERILENAGLKSDYLGEVESSSVEPGCVVKQSAEPGSDVAEGSVISFSVAAAPSKVTVPDLIGESRKAAEKELSNAGLVGVYDGEIESGSVEPGCVASQSIDPGTKVEKGTKVSFEIASEPVSTVTVPDLEGMSWSDAKSTLQSVGLKADWTGDSDGDVTYQDVAPGTTVDEGTTVTVTLTAPAPQVSVPKVEGLTWDKAKEALEESGLYADSTGASDGIVVKQAPKAGDSVDEGSTVTVTLDKNAKVSVPDVVGMSVESAREALDEAGLKSDPDMPNHGTISEQSPSAGSKAKWGSVVKLTVDDSDFK